MACSWRVSVLVILFAICLLWVSPCGCNLVFISANNLTLNLEMFESITPNVMHRNVTPPGLLSGCNRGGRSVTGLNACTRTQGLKFEGDGRIVGNGEETTIELIAGDIVVISCYFPNSGYQAEAILQFHIAQTYEDDLVRHFVFSEVIYDNVKQPPIITC